MNDFQSNVSQTTDHAPSLPSGFPATIGLASFAPLTTPKRPVTKPASRALSAHARQAPNSSGWDHYRHPSRPWSADTGLTGYSSDSRAPAVQSLTAETTNTGVDGRGRSHMWRHRLSVKRAVESQGSEQHRGSHRSHHIHHVNDADSSQETALLKQGKKPLYYFQNGRRFISDLPSSSYRYPSDLAEFQRQDLFVRLVSDLFGRPTCIQIDKSNPPQNILDVGCGSGYWAGLVHDHYVAMVSAGPN
jgi:hypothetical protein